MKRAAFRRPRSCQIAYRFLAFFLVVFFAALRFFAIGFSLGQ